MGCHISKKQPLQVVLLGASGGGKTTAVQQLSGTQDAVRVGGDRRKGRVLE